MPYVTVLCVPPCRVQHCNAIHVFPRYRPKTYIYYIQVCTFTLEVFYHRAFGCISPCSSPLRYFAHIAKEITVLVLVSGVMLHWLSLGRMLLVIICQQSSAVQSP